MTELERKAREMFVLDPAATVRWLLAQLTASEAHSENLDKSLTLTEEKLKAATETLERVNGRAQITIGTHDPVSWLKAVDALRDIRAMCAEGLRR